MSTIELKEELISKIQITENEDLLNGLLQMLEFESNNSEVYKFSDEQKMRIEEAQTQYAKGEYYTEEEADKISEKWLKE